MTSFFIRSSRVRIAASRNAKTCRSMPADFFMIAGNAERGCAPRTATAACSARSARSPARRSRRASPFTDECNSLRSFHQGNKNGLPSSRSKRRLVGAQDVALGCHVNDLSKSAGHSGALRRNENLRLAPHLHLHGNDGIKETARLGGPGRILHSGTEKARGSAMKEGSQDGNPHR